MEIAKNPDITQEELEEDFGKINTMMKGWEIPYGNRIYSGRNYDLFGMLANVRNGVGFAGIVTGTGFTPISMPKGLPNDVSPIVKSLSDSWEGDGHSHSYLTLRELLDYEWEGQTTTHAGYVEEAQYKEYKEKGQPESWSGMIDGCSIVHLEQEEMEKLISGEMERPKFKHPKTGDEQDAHCVTIVKWKVSYSWSVSYFLENTIPKLKAMCEEFVERDDRGK